MLLHLFCTMPFNCTECSLLDTSVGVGYSCPSNFQCIHNYNYLVFMLNVSFTSLFIPWWKFKKVDEERSDENEIQMLLQAT